MEFKIRLDVLKILGISFLVLLTGGLVLGAIDTDGLTATGDSSVTGDLEVTGTLYGSDLGIGFDNLTDYPSACTNQVVTGVGDSLTCNDVTNAYLTSDLDLGFGNLTDYPSACTNQVVTDVGDSLTCSDIDNNYLSSGDYNAITGIGTQAEDLDMNSNSITGITDSNATNFYQNGNKVLDAQNFVYLDTPVLNMNLNGNTSTTVYDFSGIDNDGTIQEDAHPVNGGECGRAFDFDGANDRIHIADHDSISLTDNFTISAWVNVESYTSSMSIVSKTDGSSPNPFDFYIRDSPQGRVTMSLGNATDKTDINTGSNYLSTGTWYHVATVVDNKDVTIYVDGDSSGTGTVTVPITDGDTIMKIGVTENLGRDFNGMIDELKIYDRPLSASEIEVLSYGCS